MNATATAQKPTKITASDMKSGNIFYNPADTSKLIPLRILRATPYSVSYRMGTDTLKTLSVADFISLADYMGFKNLPENAAN